MNLYKILLRKNPISQVALGQKFYWIFVSLVHDFLFPIYSIWKDKKGNAWSIHWLLPFFPLYFEL